MSTLKNFIKYCYAFSVCLLFSFVTFFYVFILFFSYIPTVNFVRVCNQSSAPVSFDVGLASGKRLLEATAERPMAINACEQTYFFPPKADSFEVSYLGSRHSMEYMSGVDFLTSYEISFSDGGVSSVSDTTNKKYVDRFIERTMDIFAGFFIPYQNGEPYWRGRFANSWSLDDKW